MKVIASPRSDRLQRLLDSGWLDLAWLAFAGANLVAMAVVPLWETVPFHFIWVSLTILYGYRVWGMFPTALVLTFVVASTGALIIFDILRSAAAPDELTEVPLMGAMFMAMVWHAQRRRSAMEDLRRVSEANLRLLRRERQFIQDASHELRTPITVALGHAELIERGSHDPLLTEDARVVVDELLRLRRLADRLLLLATAEDPEFLTRAPIDVGRLLTSVLQRWAPTERRWRLLPGPAAVVIGDADRLGLALDALVENAVKHTGSDGEVRLGARREGDMVVLAVADTGTGMPPDKLDAIFERFARLDQGRSRDRGGVGLGLAIARAIVAAHGGSVRVRSALGAGSVFELRLPAAASNGQAASAGRDRPLPAPLLGADSVRG